LEGKERAAFLFRLKAAVSRGIFYEMSWPGDGRATFHYGPEQRPGEPHIVWRRIGGHDILKNP
jgi:hypothetical protein